MSRQELEAHFVEVMLQCSSTVALMGSPRRTYISMGLLFPLEMTGLYRIVLYILVAIYPYRDDGGGGEMSECGLAYAGFVCFE